MDIKEQLGSVAPFLTSLIDGPFGVAIEKIIAEFLVGDKDANQSIVQQALANANSSQLEKLKKLDFDYNQNLAKLIINSQHFKLPNVNNNSYIDVFAKDVVPIILAILITLGFFSILFIIILYPIQADMMNVLNVMLGSLGTAWVTCVSYYFGSSYGSKVKTQLMADNLKK